MEEEEEQEEDARQMWVVLPLTGRAEGCWPPRYWIDGTHSLGYDSQDRTDMAVLLLLPGERQSMHTWSLEILPLKRAVSMEWPVV